MRIRPAKRLRGSLRVPGDKSVSHRAAMLAALARGRTTITNFSSSADCASTLECLRRLGVSVERDGAIVRVEGAGRRRRRAAPSTSVARTRLRQLGDDDASARGTSRRAAVHLRADRRRVSVGASHAPRHRAAGADGRAPVGRGRPRAAQRRGATTLARRTLRDAGRERAGQVLRAARGARRRGAHRGRGAADADARPHRAHAPLVRRRGLDTRTAGRSCGRVVGVARRRLASDGTRPDGAGRHLVRSLLRRGGRAARRLGACARRRRPEPDTRGRPRNLPLARRRARSLRRARALERADRRHTRARRGQSRPQRTRRERHPRGVGRAAHRRAAGARRRRHAASRAGWRFGTRASCA